jgi:hypothetical protein
LLPTQRWRRADTSRLDVGRSPIEAAGRILFASDGYAARFSHVEEFYTKVNGRLPMVLEIELKQLGLQYSKGHTHGARRLSSTATW